MEKDLHKRLEEAARKSFEERYPDGIDLYKDAQIDGFIAGAEYGYKEAIAQAKRWLDNEWDEALSNLSLEKRLVRTE